MKKLSLFGLGAGLIAALSFTPELAIADGHKMSTLETVKKRGHLRCQVGQPSPGFYNLKKDGTWVGSDVSVCRAVAAAISAILTKLNSNQLLQQFVSPH